MAFDAGVLYNLTPRLDCLLDQHSQWPGYDRCYVIDDYGDCIYTFQTLKLLMRLLPCTVWSQQCRMGLPKQANREAVHMK